MKEIQVFDPPMCCSNGICGSSDDPTLVTFASDLEWLKKQGVNVVRHSLSFEPAEFSKNRDIKELLNKKGNSCLPIITIGTKIVLDSCYPSREKLASICKVEFNEEEAPPIHREENCCCKIKSNYGSNSKNHADRLFNEKSPLTCDCTNAAAEDNCFCISEGETHKALLLNKKNKKIFFFVLLLIILTLIAIKILPKANSLDLLPSTNKNTQKNKIDKNDNFSLDMDSHTGSQQGQGITFVHN